MNRRKFLAGLAAAATSTKLATGLPTGLLAKAIDELGLSGGDVVRTIVYFHEQAADFMGTVDFMIQGGIGELKTRDSLTSHAQQQLATYQFIAVTGQSN